MLKLMLPKHILQWLLDNKGGLSLPVYIIHCIAYIKDNKIDPVIKERELHQERGEYDRAKRFNRKGEDKHLDTM